VIGDRKPVFHCGDAEKKMEFHREVFMQNAVAKNLVPPFRKERERMGHPAEK
jgi:hypothetical protein